MSTPKEKFMDFFVPRELRPESTSSDSGGAKSQKVLKAESLQKRFFDGVLSQCMKSKYNDVEALPCVGPNWN